MTPVADPILQRVRDSDVVALCRDLVRIKSVNPPGDERPIAEFVGNVLRDAGLSVELLPHDGTRASVLARLPGSGERPGLLYSAHLDTVPVGAEPWLHDPFAGEVAEGKVWGRGAADMKGGLAAMLTAARVLAQAHTALRGDLVLALTAGEEVDSLGAAAVAARSDLGPLSAIIVSEPSDNDVYVAEKGALWLEITTRGKTAHGSMPDLGRNAISMMVPLLAELERLNIPYKDDSLLGGFTRSVNTISGGVKTNVVPDLCTATVDMRTVPGQDHAAIVRQVELLAERLARDIPGFRASVRVVNDRQPVMTPVDHPLVQQFVGIVAEITGTTPQPKGVRYYTDAATLAPALGLPMIICGPGQAGLAHQPNEYVEIHKLVEAARIMTLAALRLLA